MQKKSSQRKKSLLLATITTAALLLAGCADVSPRIQHDSESQKERREKSGYEKTDVPFGNQDKSVNNETGENGKTIAPTSPTSANVARGDKKVALILGPGGFKAFAHAGVIKELRKANIPINAVMGIEWGALVGALYAQRGQIHEAEWKLYKLEKLDLNSTGIFSRKRQSKSIKDLEGFLNENLENKDVAQMSVPFSCPSLSLGKGTLTLQKAGPLSAVVQKCLPLPPLLTPTGDDIAGALSLPDMIGQLKSDGYNVIIFVNVLGDGNLFDKSDTESDYATVVLWDEVRRQIWQARSMVTDEIDVTTRGIALGDFESRKILVTAGEAAGEHAARALLTKYGF